MKYKEYEIFKSSIRIIISIMLKGSFLLRELPFLFFDSASDLG